MQCWLFVIRIIAVECVLEVKCFIKARARTLNLLGLAFYTHQSSTMVSLIDFLVLCSVFKDPPCTGSL